MVTVMELNDYGKNEGVREDISEVDDGAPKKYSEMRDKMDMDRIGKKQELKRNFRLFSIFSFMCVAMSSWVFVIR